MQEQITWLQAFYTKAVEMRDAQKAYFATRTAAALDLSKKLEREVDALIKEQSNNIINSQSQPTLF